ncbi:HVA1 family protein [Aurantimonas marianensis]|uniref:HVA1 family protein n=1 Tax=Aurantimonas marianensis TaxID=2920428 RepID=UPI00311A9A4A
MELGNGTGAGEVSESFAEKVSRTIRGTEVTRDADDQNPAYLIEQEDGGKGAEIGIGIDEGRLILPMPASGARGTGRHFDPAAERAKNRIPLPVRASSSRRPGSRRAVGR